MPHQAKEQAFYSTKQVADMFGVHRETVKNWIREGKLAAIKIGGATGYRIPEEAIEDFTQRRLMRDAIVDQLAKAS